MQQIAPATKTTAMMRIVPRRPRISETRLQVSAPMIAPSRMLAAMSCFHVLPMSKSSSICNSAPEMIPVSYP